MNNAAMLNAYPDSLAGRLSGAAALIARPEFADVFRSFYILPSLYHTDLDRGFSVISYDLDRRLATQDDLDALHAQGLDLKLDFILNHLSVLSPQFQDIVNHGEDANYRDFFIDWNTFWQDKGEMTPQGYIQPDASLIKDMFFRKPGLPILMVRFPDGRDVPYWNTFYQEVRYDAPDAQDLMRAIDVQYGEATEIAALLSDALAKGQTPAEMELGRYIPYRSALINLLESRRKYLGQMDLNLKSDLVWAYYDETLKRLREYGAAIVRLDAFAYAPKEAGARNFLNEPDTWTVLERVQEMADKYEVPVLARMPLDPALSALVEEGRIEDYDASYMEEVIKRIATSDVTTC